MNAAKIDLHLHLDGSLYLPWAWKTAVKQKKALKADPCETLVGVALRAVLFRRQRVGQICLCGCVTTPSHQPPHMILYHR